MCILRTLTYQTTKPFGNGRKNQRKENWDKFFVECHTEYEQKWRTLSRKTIWNTKPICNKVYWLRLSCIKMKLGKSILLLCSGNLIYRQCALQISSTIWYWLKLLYQINTFWLSWFTYFFQLFASTSNLNTRAILFRHL